MTDLNNNQRFIEICDEAGTHLGFALKAKCHEEQTPYQTIAIYETEKFGYLMTIDGFVMLTTRDNFLYHEMMTHPALFTHPNPQDVIVIGGGDCGSLREILKHNSVKSAWQVDIDEKVTRLAEKYFPELCESNNDLRAHIEFCDGIQWIAGREPASADIIIVDSTDPIGPAEGLFSRDFYANCLKVLRKNGLLIHQSESPLIHYSKVIQPMHEEMQQAGFKQQQVVFFPQPCYPSGWWSGTMTSQTLPLNQFRENASHNKTFQTVYYNAEIHKAALALPEFMRK